MKKVSLYALGSSLLVFTVTVVLLEVLQEVPEPPGTERHPRGGKPPVVSQLANPVPGPPRRPPRPRRRLQDPAPPATAEAPPPVTVSGLVVDEDGCGLEGVKLEFTEWERLPRPEIIEGAAVLLPGPGLGASSRCVSGPRGRYRVELPQGDYHVAVEGDGFHDTEERYVAILEDREKDYVLDRFRLLTVTVLSATTRTAIDGARVEVRVLGHPEREHVFAISPLESSTTEVGQCQVRGLWADAYPVRIEVKARGWFPQTRTVHDPKVTELVVRLDPAAFVSVECCDSTTQGAVRRLWLELSRWSEKGWMPVVRGEANRCSVPPGEYRLQAHSHGYEEVIETLGFLAGGEERKVKLSMVPQARKAHLWSLRGKVLELPGKLPIRDGRVLLYRNEQLVNVSMVDAAGTYRLAGVQPGCGALVAEASGWAPRTRRFCLEDIPPGTRESPTREFDISFYRPATLKGLVVDESGQPLDDVTVILERNQGYLQKSEESGFCFYDLEPGSYDLLLEIPDAAPQLAGAQVTRASRNLHLRAGPFELVPGQVDHRVVGLRDTATLEGVVLWPGHSLKGLHLIFHTLVPGGDRVRELPDHSARPTPEGRFALRGFRPGNYQVFVHPLEISFLVAIPPSAEPECCLQIGSERWLQGEVRDARTGHAVVAHVSAGSEDPPLESTPGRGWLYSQWTWKDSEFGFHYLRPAEYQVIVRAQGYREKRLQVDLRGGPVEGFVVEMEREEESR